MASPRRSRKVLWLLVAGAAVAAWQLGPRYLQKRSGTERLVNQLWIERLPRDDRDLVRFQVLLEKDADRHGLLGTSSQWRQRLDGFVWRLDSNVLHARFPQDGRQGRVRVRTWRCTGEAPAPFDWCLELTAGERSFRYFSRDDWRVRPKDGTLEDDDARAELGGLASVLRPLEGVHVDQPGEEAGESAVESWPFDLPAP
jgi:hypothetical protein